MGFSLRRSAYGDLRGWSEDSVDRAFVAFRRSARQAISVGPYRTGRIGAGHEDFRPAFAAAAETGNQHLDAGAARRFFETWFLPYAITLDDGGSGLVTGFYEPVVEVRATPDARHVHPFLRPPLSLIKVLDPANPPTGIPEGFAFCMRDGETWRICPDRGAIETGALAGQGLEIAYAAEKADVFFAHVQGAARLDFGDGTRTRITYAAKSGHPFTGIGRLLVDRGEIPLGEISMQSIRSWLAAHPLQADGLMRENRSYIFFREAPVDDESLGPVAAAKVPLEPGRSMAVDRTIHTFGTPFFVSAPDLKDFAAARPFARLMIAQDTGSAILGPARGDLFTGSGDSAGDLAGAIRNHASFTILLPKIFDASRLARHG
ncbi:membrane-bound lytic murein transglycosylase A [Hoeflea marina]|uniref:peptidoglycan lytic exotransglycosylase n=1 Tax=Hoeflea marina TaxID=274592 RepID=A0A317PQ20_9HYPH|nr:MltA domain-containing protein [Hoeflea marina]PWW00541.1 membrane-bound lytic murein transglycosylase A [Hoeflea marina]